MIGKHYFCGIKINKMKSIIKDALQNAMTYQQYREKIEVLLTQQLSTGHTQNDVLLQFSQLNVTRMNRLDKTIVVPEEIQVAIQQIQRPMIWLVITEGWCGDAAQIIPVLHHLSKTSDQVEFLLVLRDDNDALMQKFLTNGGKSIPKLIALDAETLEVLFDWGPRPEGAHQLIQDYKAQHGKIDDYIKTELQKWYTKDKGLQIMQEVLKMVQNLELVS